MKKLNFNEYKNLLATDFEEYSCITLENAYKCYIKHYMEKENKAKEHSKKCCCNICMSNINEYNGFKKYDVYTYKGIKVWINDFCPLENCKDVFIKNYNGFCKWLTTNEARKMTSLGYSVLEKRL